MRISVRQQLSLILILSGCIGLAVLAIATWFANHHFVLSVSSQRLSTTAALKAAQVAYNLELMQTAATFVTTREILQQSLARYDNGSFTNSSNWNDAVTDLESTLGDVGPLSNALALQVELFPRNQSGPDGTQSVLNVTGRGGAAIKLPWNDANGSQAYLGEVGGYGYPPALYPNLTVSEQRNESGSPIYVATYNGMSLGPGDTLVLGPLLVNDSYSLISVTLPIVNNTARTDILGWVTVTCTGRLIQSIIQDPTGLGSTGQTLLVGPVNTTNMFAPDVLGTTTSDDTEVRYIMPLNDSSTNRKRHASHVVGMSNLPFPASAYPAVETAMAREPREYNDYTTNDYGTLLNTYNEENKSVSAGYAVPQTQLVDWIVIVEQAKSEVWEPINRLRIIILACLFSVMGFLFIVSFPVAHWFVLPIIRLRSATEETIDPPHRASSSGPQSHKRGCSHIDGASSDSVLAKKVGFLGSIAWWRKRRNSWHTTTTTELESDEPEEKRFRIPGKVRQRKQWIADEMSDLIKTFNEMSDELLMQYTVLEDRVKQRTIELEHSKKAAEAANESKTLFVANVSHELKTPLNGIMGMCAVSIAEEDPSRLKRSMGIIYKSGDLLLRTLSDLLTFSSNQVGHQVLTLDEKEFNLRDLETQVYSIFSEQAKDNNIDLRVQFEDAPRFGKLRDITLWGDVHRILQVIINLTSNSLKFTPTGGSVTVIMRALSEIPQRNRSVKLDAHKQRNRNSAAYGSISSGTANFINPREVSEMQEKSAAPPGKDLFIEFELRDTGPGISEDMQHKIFEPFVQGDVGLNRKHSGTGLGLSICSQLASLMKGSIHLQSKVGEGSIFTVKIPLRQLLIRAETPKSSQNSIAPESRRTSLIRVDTNVPTVQTLAASSVSPTTVVTTSNIPSIAVEEPSGSIALTPVSPISTAKLAAAATTADSPLKQAVKNASKEVKAKKEAKQDFSKVRVLVAEDNKVNQEVILRMLKLEQIHDVTIAENGQVALDLVKTSSSSSASSSSEDVSAESPPYDLIFMDVQMPEMDGLTSTKLIRQSGFTRPIVALTAFAEQSNIEECYGSGMDYFLAKPIRRPQLKKVLTQYCTPSPIPENKEEGGEAVKENVSWAGTKEAEQEKKQSDDVVVTTTATASSSDTIRATDESKSPEMGS